jgi:mannose-6-phosphate isomerase-like protein (cupin superfamily)
VTTTRLRGLARRILLPALAVAAAWATTGCRTQQTPEPPLRARIIDHQAPSLPELQPYLDLYPLEGQGTRMDLLAMSTERSMHLVQTNRAIAPHFHEKHTEISYVLTGKGTVYIEKASYPAVGGSAFRITPGRIHSVHPEPGSTLRAVVYYEPPLKEGEVDRVLVDENGRPLPE